MLFAQCRDLGTSRVGNPSLWYSPSYKESLDEDERTLDLSPGCGKAAGGWEHTVTFSSPKADLEVWGRGGDLGICAPGWEGFT
ncbi:unnamed protein product [Gadus morhua 'NCC']